jgi:hypothetical protein
MAATRPAATFPPTVCQTHPNPPLSDCMILELCHKLLYRLLPYLDPEHLRADQSTYRVANYVGQVADEIRITRQDTYDRADSTRATKMSLQYFAEIGSSRLVILCGVDSEVNLPEVWRMVPKFGKKDCMTVKLAIKQTAQRVGMAHRAPIITPEFTKCLLSL